MSHPLAICLIQLATGPVRGIIASRALSGLCRDAVLSARGTWLESETAEEIPMTNDMDAPRIVIVGVVAGGPSSAARARRVNECARITIYERDAYISFANCGLPYYFSGQISDRASLLVASP